MYLKEIKISGFKSFADKMEIHLDDQVTCIVGPNGSGKSNVVDAVRFVLGEQSVKSLRGSQSMKDIIFSGSKRRGPLNLAQVELVFDNHDHMLSLDYDLVSVRRKAYRSGENEYFLNNQHCRLKDITNLFLDTGVGREAFNIIGQGEVERIISTNAVDRRVIIEEVAGVLKYKKRKEEASRKLLNTHNNLERVNDIIRELEIQLEPLEKESSLAKDYLSYKEKLKEVEVGLLSYDLYAFYEEVKRLEERLKEIQLQIVDCNRDSFKNDERQEVLQSTLKSLEEKLDSYNATLMEVVEDANKLNNERTVLSLKNRDYNPDNNKKELQHLLLEESKRVADIHLLESEISSLKEEVHSKSDIMKSHDSSQKHLKEKKMVLRSDFSHIEQELISIRRKIEQTEEEMEQLSYMPKSIKRVLQEESLDGIYDTLGHVVHCESKFSKAMDVALNASKNFVITRDEKAGMEAVRFLKREKLGRATFFPVNVIKERYIDHDTLTLVRNSPDFIAVFSDLVECDSLYQSIIKNQLGLVLLSPDMESSNRLSELVKRRYKVISLDGDQVNVGGSITGGDSPNWRKSSILLEQELKFLKEEEKSKLEQKVKISDLIDQVDQSIQVKSNEYFQISLEDVNLKEKLSSKEKDLKYLQELLEKIQSQIHSLKSIVSDHGMDYEKEIYDKYLEKNNQKEILNQKILHIKKEIDRVKEEIDNANSLYKLQHKEIRDLEREESKITGDIQTIHTKMDEMLSVLNQEYHLTYEKAREEYVLTTSAEDARKKVSFFKEQLQSIGMVNLRSIEEFERVNTRYQFLCKEKEDLLSSTNSLLEIMKDMDEVIKEEFTKTYQEVDLEFGKVFQELFGGGKAHLELTDSSNMLESGVDIVASPPGKKLKSIRLLSGGEKTLTAISLLFAILNVRDVPFCLFDEVEAALDDANVETFGKYLSRYTHKTQFLIITHKKKTMEYADTLYGITMQESGVSRLVSVKLDHHIDTL